MILSKRSVVLILISVFILNTIGMGVYTYVPRYLLYLNIEIPLIQLLVTIFPLTAFIFPPFLGKYSDKIQNRYLFLIIGAIGMPSSFILLLFTQNLILILFFLLIYGFFSVCSSINFVLYAELVENDEKFISYFNASIVFGWFLGAQLGGIYIELYGINYIFQFLLIFSIINIVFVIFIKENRALILERQKNESNINKEVTFLNKLEEKSPISKSIYSSLFFRNFGIRPILSVLAIIMIFHLSSDTQIGFLIGINPLIQFFLIILIGRTIKSKNIKLFMIIGYSLSVVVIFGYIFSIDFFGYLIYQIIISFSYAMFWTATQIYIAQNTTPENKGKYIGYANSSFNFGSFMGGLYFSLLLALYSDYYIAMYFTIIFPGLSALIILVKFEQEK